MTISDVLKLMESPELLDRDTLPQLKSLVEEYPYFQTVRMLYLKNLQMERDLTFPMELRKMAFYAIDRRKLYYWIEKNRFASFNFGNLEKKESGSFSDTFATIDSFLATEVTDGELQLFGKDPSQLASTDYLSLVPEEKQNEQVDVQPLKHQKTIDEFLEKDKQSPVKINMKNTETSAVIEPQIEEKTEFFGETLAKIYKKQKKYEKALQIIQNLCLQYPEKSAYFAVQIEELEKLITNNK